jgi:cytochrome c peroxidase
MSTRNEASDAQRLAGDGINVGAGGGLDGMTRSATRYVVLAVFITGCSSPSTASQADGASDATQTATMDASLDGDVGLDAAAEDAPSPNIDASNSTDGESATDSAENGDASDSATVDATTATDGSDAATGSDADPGASSDAMSVASDASVADSGSSTPSDGGVCGLSVDGGLAPAPASFATGHAIDATFCDGRSCTTCHRPDRAFSIGPADVEALYQANPNDPLFRDVDRDPDGTFTTLRTYALFNVIIALPDNVSDVDHPSARTITVRRAAPSLFNLYFDPGPFLDDGRAATLEAQVPGAVLNHFETGAPILAGFVADATQFERSIFSDPTLAAAVSGGPANSNSVYYSIPLASPSALVVQGRTVFQSNCENGCHSDPESNDLGRGFQTNVSAQVSETNAIGLPVLQLNIGGTVYQTPDPGIFSSPNSFFAPQLRAISQTAPYFHDHSAATLDAVLDHYQSTKIIPTLSDTDRQALLAYLNAL